MGNCYYFLYFHNILQWACINFRVRNKVYIHTYIFFPINFNNEFSSFKIKASV